MIRNADALDLHRILLNEVPVAIYVHFVGFFVQLLPFPALVPVICGRKFTCVSLFDQSGLRSNLDDGIRHEAVPVVRLHFIVWALDKVLRGRAKNWLKLLLLLVFGREHIFPAIELVQPYFTNLRLLLLVWHEDELAVETLFDFERAEVLVSRHSFVSTVDRSMLVVQCHLRVDIWPLSDVIELSFRGPQAKVVCRQLLSRLVHIGVLGGQLGRLFGLFIGESLLLNAVMSSEAGLCLTISMFASSCLVARANLRLFRLIERRRNVHVILLSRQRKPFELVRRAFCNQRES